ncbi:MAG: hypothetical protein ACJ8DZ_06945 [Allosphingosinicella sp.]
MVERDEADLSLAEWVDKASRRVTTAVLMAGALIAISIYARPGPPRYDVAAADGRVVRVDTRKGDMISCGADGCISVHRPGGRIERNGKLPALPAPAVPAAAPAPQPSATPAPAAR